MSTYASLWGTAHSYRLKLPHKFVMVFATANLPGRTFDDSQIRQHGTRRPDSVFY